MEGVIHKRESRGKRYTFLVFFYYNCFFSFFVLSRFYEYEAL